MATSPPIRVAVIGGGPAGMFFCHAAEKQKALQESDSSLKLKSLEITCFEKAALPGGVWKDTSTCNGFSQIYDELWTNGPCYNVELYDHTIAEHFQGEQVPVYWPRKDMHEYIMTRVTKGNPNFFEKYFVFNTEVSNVCFDNETEKFHVRTRNVDTNEVTMRVFDKCIWAAGEHGRPNIPPAFSDLLNNSEEPFTGKVFHSAETHKMKAFIPNANVLLLGGGESAEDLALQCCKWGAKHVDIVSRSFNSPVTWTSEWPGRKVEIHLEFQVKAVEGSTFHLEQVELVWPNKFIPLDGGEIERVDGIDIVVLCTGYKSNIDMLNQALRPTGGLPHYGSAMEELETDSLRSKLESIGWTMPVEGNAAHEFLGCIPPGEERLVHYLHQELYNGILVSNPNMMYVLTDDSESPMVSLDSHAWLLCAYLTGYVDMPSPDEMRERNLDAAVDLLSLPYGRYLMDEAYAKRALALPEDGKFWPLPDGSSENCAFWDIEADFFQYTLRRLARIMEEGRYPGVSFGTYRNLNDVGMRNIVHDELSGFQRGHLLEEEVTKDELKAVWLTFRDIDISDQVSSFYTGNKARPLKKPWMEAIGSVSVKDGDI